MYGIIKRILFRMSPERAHYFTMNLLDKSLKIPGVAKILNNKEVNESRQLGKKVMGIYFKNPVGLAAGFDKDGKFYPSLQQLGFGFIEIGTVTPKPQPGNPKPRLFRVIEDEGLINRMGFNNEGVEALVRRLKKQKPQIIIGGNIGKNKVTPNEKADEDYLFCFDALFNYVDYFVVNVSSPNTPNLRALQDKEPLTQLLNKLQTENKKKENPKPILLKIAPDVNESELNDIIDVVKETKIDGVIATNTTVSRSNLKTSEEKLNAIGNGGLSGKPVKERSTEVIRQLRTALGDNYTIIGVGGIHSAEDAVEKLTAGADLIQIYTGFIYEGPNLINRINKAILVGNFTERT